MKNYKVSKIYIENFKLIDKALIDIQGEELIVLDGPNGFGKTTIFDAIELVLTGKISRIENYNGQLGFNTLLFSKDNSKDTVIKIEFTSDSDTFTFVKWYIPGQRLQKRDRKPDNWNLFNTYKISDFKANLSQAIQINQQDIYEYLGLNEDLERLYNLYYYIQQEDNTRFLKQAGRKRMETINHLFDTHIQQEEQKKISNVRNILREEKIKVVGEIKQSKEKIKNYKGLASKEEENEVNYASLLIEGTEIEWDKEDLEIKSKEQKDKYIEELMEIEDFVRNFGDFKKSLFNKGLDQITSNVNLLENSIIASTFMEEYEQIEKRHKKEEKFLKMQEDLKKGNFLKNIKEINFRTIAKEINIETDIEDMEQIKKSIMIQQSSASELSKVVQQLNDTRNKLLDHFNGFLGKTEEAHGECPFCGCDWGNFEELLNEIETKRKSFLQYYDDSTEIMEKTIDELYEKHINSILSGIKEELENETLIDKDFFNQLKIAISSRNKIKGFHHWCKENNIDYLSYVNKKSNQQVNDIDSRVEAFSDHLLKHRKEVKEGYFESDPKFNGFEYLYKNTFQNSEENVKKVTEESIKQKKKYINYIFYRYNSEQIEKETKILKRHEFLEQNISDKITMLDEIHAVYDSEIRKHWNKIMTDIEIPFYIYSGKIIQEYQKGLGVFIEENPTGEARNIKFVSDNEYDHDAIHYLSSGQLSALVISFTLALNKVYGNQSVDIILIDDPVQTMDEINMASFTELLRNEFSHKQIIISTHEEDVSRYLRYKFKKYNLNAMKFNVKDNLLLPAN